MSETPGWISPGSPEPAPGTFETGHPAPPAPQASAASAPPPAPGPTAGIIPLRPLGLVELMDGAFALVRTYWKAAFGFGLALACVLELVQAGINWWIHVSGTYLEASFSTYYTVPLEMLAGVLVTGLLTPIIGNSLLGRDTTPKEAWAQARPHLGRLSLLALLHTLILIGALAAPLVPVMVLAAVTEQPGWLVLALPAVLPWLWVYVKLIFAAPALVLEKQTPVAALKRSWRLTRGSWWRFFGTMLLFGIVIGLLSAVLVVPGEIVSMIVGGGPNSLFFASDGDAALSIGIMAVCGILAKTLTVPLTGTLLGLLYVDQRIRREALDIELARATGLPGHHAPAATAPAPGQYPPSGV
ncbi:glycerophosphoryl diester phosphodiesterase membrane domain-containing protein [Kitasatospora sp. NPDC004531]